MAFGYIYKIVNQINGKIYVGQTICNIKKRFREHKHASLNQNTYLYNAMRKYGVENFSIMVIDCVNSLDELNEKEIYWIKKLNSKTPNGYNILDGGLGVKGFHHSKETKELLKIKSTGNKNAKGKHNLSIEGRKNMILAHKDKVSNFKNKKHTEMAKSKLSQKHSKKVKCIETNIIYPSSLIASKTLNIANKIGCCCNGKRKTCGGYHWSWV